MKRFGGRDGGVIHIFRLRRLKSYDIRGRRAYTNQMDETTLVKRD